jgi:hypothetical protein
MDVMASEIKTKIYRQERHIRAKATGNLSLLLANLQE